MEHGLSKFTRLFLCFYWESDHAQFKILFFILQEIKKLSAVLASQEPFDTNKYAYIANVCVAKFARRQGIASNMLYLATDVATMAGVITWNFNIPCSCCLLLPHIFHISPSDFVDTEMDILSPVSWLWNRDEAALCSRKCRQ